MKFTPLPVAGAFRIDLKPHRDARGYFARTWCADSFKAHGIEFSCVQANVSHTKQRGTIRGMHYQLNPKPDAKIVRCTRGRIFQVVADARPGSPTYCRWCATELSEYAFNMAYVPPGCAQGFQSLTDNVTVEYSMGERYDPSLYGGFRYDDPLVGIDWPLPVTVLSEQDLQWPPLVAPPLRPAALVAAV